jgi:hypothetical protein
MLSHPAYGLAKRGEDNEAALQLVYDCIADQARHQVRAQLGFRKPRVVAVHAEGRRQPGKSICVILLLTHCGGRTSVMDSNVSPKAKRAIFGQPRQLTPSETASLRQDAISTSTDMKMLMKERQERQKWSIRRMIGLEIRANAAE